MHPSDEHGEAGAGREMPRYISHKKVWALEIETVDPGLCRLTFKEAGFAPIETDRDMWLRYRPVPGDFYVQYADGYKSFSPRKAFIEGYKLERSISEKPTIAELEAILREPDAKVQIQPDGSVKILL